MLVFSSLLESAAKAAEMKVPDNPDGYDWSPDDFPHFHVFCNVQLCRPMQPGEHWDNAKVIAAIPEDEIKEISLEGLLNRGLRYQS